mmetsp:Transcript_26629/g.57259  ORF Transcript_26629/g.57259 Transcript_26629/m.57259 type:complete len:287 (-) Transcript_26629:550-1410(-)|eukprot:CAMPEP_0172303766 /NCGR_PEP_ID=MMETSP1058-20130122/5279_1 /TAXON_ID=83371 /ORGANISM="Detonula confervacea, Strain CCMP 353" /LENGTH=286 /DNA_ID=CAMNT_0013014733 /DNA_START=30 /DNA_END=890 /DNA_ORIENTATION=+
MNSAAEQQLSPRTQAALQYLRRLKPLDGYAVERYLASSGNHLVRLKRRNIPVHDEGFEEIVVDRLAGNVVGIQVVTSRGDAGRGIVLVDKNGKLCDDKSTVTVQMANVSTSSVGSQRRSAPTRSSSSRASSTTATTPISDADNQLLIQYGLMALGALLVLKIIFTALNILSILLIPLIYLYASGNCPSNDTFDAKKELKRVMRGAHLPEENQPKGFFEQGFNRLAASVTTELATSLGYEISITDFVGAAKMASVKVPVANAEYYWVGIFGKWRFIGQREIPGRKND